MPDATPPVPPSSAPTPHLWRYVVAAVLCALALVKLYRSPYSASNLDFPPDAQEHVIAAQRLVLFGSYSIEINGVSYPPRYPPWFSVLVLAPFYAVGKH